MSKIKEFERELRMRDLAKALPGHKEAIDSTLNQLAALKTEMEARDNRIAELEALTDELRKDSHDAAKAAGTNASRAQKAEAELQRIREAVPAEVVNKQAICWFRSSSLAGNYRDGYNDFRAEMLRIIEGNKDE